VVSEVVAVDPALEALVREGLDELGWGADGGRARGLAYLAQHMAVWSERMNLTGLGTSEQIVRHLILDAAAQASALPSFETCADLGSGAGIPGIPLAILFPDRSFVLVESREKRHHFQRSVLRALGIQNAVPRLGRAETLDPEPADLAIAQAMGPPGRVLTWLCRWSRPGGWVALPATPSAEPPAIPDGVLSLERRSYRVPLDGPERVLWLGRRSG